MQKNAFWLKLVDEAVSLINPRKVKWMLSGCDVMRITDEV